MKTIQYIIAMRLFDFQSCLCGLLLMFCAESSLADDGEKPVRTETETHLIYKNAPINMVFSDLAKLAGGKYYPNEFFDNKDEYLVEGEIEKSTGGTKAYDELAFQYGFHAFHRDKGFWIMTNEQLEKLPRDKFLWKVRYIESKDIPKVKEQLLKCFTAIDSRIDYLPKRNILKIQGRWFEVEDAEKLLDELDSEAGAKKLSEKKVVEQVVAPDS